MVKSITLAFQLTGAIQTRLLNDGHESECTHVNTNITHTGTWKSFVGACSVSCGVGVQTVTWECHDGPGDNSNLLSKQLCKADDDQITEQACTHDTIPVCPCVIDPATYWYLTSPLDDPDVPAGTQREFPCTKIPNYPLKDAKAIFDCSSTGVLTETPCPCIERGRANKHNEKNVNLIEGNWQDVFDSETMIPNDNWLTWMETERTDRNDGTNFTLEISQGHYGQGASMVYLKKDSSSNVDSIVKNMTPMNCMKLCIAHNNWKQNSPQDGCIVAVPEKPSSPKTPCRLRKGSISAYNHDDTSTILTKDRDTYSYDMKCFIERLDPDDLPTSLESDQKAFWREVSVQTMYQ